ncbi:UDP-glucose 6-dehydrogenase [Filimonas sp.]|nr:UDP-glucose 6-dehydrogenase [Filimonas sp.]
MEEKGIPSMIYYPIPAHRQKMFEHYGIESTSLATTDWLAAHVISLPIHTEMTEEQMNYMLLNYRNLKYYLNENSSNRYRVCSLVSGTCFAESGNEVICVDIDKKKSSGFLHGILSSMNPDWKYFSIGISRKVVSVFLQISKRRSSAQILFFWPCLHHPVKMVQLT